MKRRGKRIRQQGSFLLAICAAFTYSLGEYKIQNIKINVKRYKKKNTKAADNTLHWPGFQGCLARHEQSTLGTSLDLVTWASH